MTRYTHDTSYTVGSFTRRRMHGIFGERERANWDRVSTPTCAASLVSAASQSREAPAPADFQLFEAHFICLPPSAASEVRAQLDPFLRKNDMLSFAVLHPSRTTEPSFERVEFCAAFMKFHICARIYRIT